MKVVRINKIESEANKVKNGYSYYIMFSLLVDKEAETVFDGSRNECLNYINNL